MPDQTKSIIAGGGGDYTTIASWESSINVAGGFYVGEIQDNSNYNEEVTISGVTGTPSASNYIELRSSTSNRHSGVEGTGHARMVGSLSTTGRYLTLYQDYTRIVGLEIFSQSTGASDEGIRLENGASTGLVIDSCIIHADEGATDQDGIYGYAYDSVIDIKNCILYDWTRGCIHQQNYTGQPDMTWNVYYCVADNGGEGVYMRYKYTASTAYLMTYNIYNSAGFNAGTGVDVFEEVGSSVNAVWAGNNNVADDTSCESKFTSSHDSVTLTDNNSASGEVYTIANVTNDDYTSEENDGTGTDRLAAAGASVSVTVDILGNSRDGSTPDIGPFEIQAAAPAGRNTFMLLGVS